MRKVGSNPNETYRVIAEKPEDKDGQMPGTIVLAVNDDLSQYVVWWYRLEDGACYNGDYFPRQAYVNDKYSVTAAHFLAAAKAFEERKGY